jgi:hypothetical protein
LLLIVLVVYYTVSHGHPGHPGHPANVADTACLRQSLQLLRILCFDVDSLIYVCYHTSQSLLCSTCLLFDEVYVVLVSIVLLRYK